LKGYCCGMWWFLLFLCWINLECVHGLKWYSCGSDCRDRNLGKNLGPPRGCLGPDGSALLRMQWYQRTNRLMFDWLLDPSVISFEITVWQIGLFRLLFLCL
jgi:hypothetical protein